VTEFIVHIGPHKTGTTYLQATLDGLRGDLSARGIRLASDWNATPDIHSHMKLVWGIRSGDLAMLRDQVRAMLEQRPKYVVISCEALSRLDLQQIASLRDLLGSAWVSIVYYVRRSPERIASLWQETVKFGYDATFPEFFTRQLTASKQSELWDTAMLDRYASVFGPERLKIVSYSYLVDHDIDIARHFLTEFLRETGLKLLPNTRHNRSLPPAETEIIRMLNTLHRQSGGEQSPALRNWFLRNKEALVTDTLLEVMQGSLDTIGFNEAEQPFVLPFKDLVGRYAQAIVPPHHAGGLHEPRTVEATFMRQDYLSMAPCLGVLRSIYMKYIESQ
jgi:hypothetical protein